MNRDAIHRHIDAHLDEHIANVLRWVRQPSVSWDDGRGVHECATLVAESYRALGCTDVEILDGRFHPGVWAVYDAGAPVTLHSYCMFDTRTASPAGWSQDPWSAALVARPPYPRVLVGRGAFSAKGPYVAFLNALSSICRRGRLPVNVLFPPGRGGGRPHGAFVEQYRDRPDAQLSHRDRRRRHGTRAGLVRDIVSDRPVRGRGRSRPSIARRPPSWTRHRSGSPRRWRR